MIFESVMFMLRDVRYYCIFMGILGTWRVGILGHDLEKKQ